MALDVWIGKPTRFEGRPAVSFEPEAYYSFLYPLFEQFSKSYGKMIDPYDGASFEPGELGVVLELVDKAHALVSAQPDEFRVHMGTNLGSSVEPKHEEIYHSVNRAEYLEFIDRLRSAVIEAQRSCKPLVFFGD